MNVLFKPLIEFCLNNLASGSDVTKALLEKDAGLDVIDYGCLSYCGQCGESLFALVDGEVIKGEDAKDLVAKIYKHLEHNPIR